MSLPFRHTAVPGFTAMMVTRCVRAPTQFRDRAREKLRQKLLAQRAAQAAAAPAPAHSEPGLAAAAERRSMGASASAPAHKQARSGLGVAPARTLLGSLQSTAWSLAEYCLVGCAALLSHRLISCP